METPEGVGPEGDYYAEEPDYSDLTDEPSDGAAPPSAAGEADHSQPPAAPAFTDNHYAWGEHLGMSKAEVEKFGDPKLFERMVYNVSAMLRTQTVQQQQALAAQYQQAYQQAYQQPQIPTYVQPFQPFQFPQGEDGQFDPVLVQQNQHFNGYLAHMGQTLNQIIHQQQQGLQQIHQQVQADYEARQAVLENREFDTLVDTLGFEDLFGKGEYGSLGDKSHQSNRAMLAKMVGRLAQTHTISGEEVPPMPVLVKAALGAVFGDNIRRSVTQGIANAAQARARQATNPPSRREGRPLNPTERAIKTAAAKMREHGWFDDEPTDK